MSAVEALNIYYSQFPFLCYPCFLSGNKISHFLLHTSVNSLKHTTHIYIQLSQAQLCVPSAYLRNSSGVGQGGGLEGGNKCKEESHSTDNLNISLPMCIAVSNTVSYNVIIVLPASLTKKYLLKIKESPISLHMALFLLNTTHPS